MKLGRALLGFCILVIPIVTGAQVIGYSDDPLRNPVFDSAKVLVETVGVNNWLHANFSRLSPEQNKGVREHVHALIDSRVKEIYLRDRLILPKQPDPILPILFSWAGRLGVYGADAVYRAIQGTYPVVPPPAPATPLGLRLTLDGQLLHITSEFGGWSVAVPYYFFISEMHDGSGTDAQRMQAIVLSLGTARDDAQPGYSQATIGIFFHQTLNHKALIKHGWNVLVLAPFPKKR